jgi:hypothetical protein
MDQAHDEILTTGTKDLEAFLSKSPNLSLISLHIIPSYIIPVDDISSF